MCRFVYFSFGQRSKTIYFLEKKGCIKNTGDININMNVTS